MKTKLGTALLFTLLPVPAFAQEAPTAVSSAVDQVTVYADSARVRRTAEPITEDGLYVFEGLTRALDPDNVRVRLEGGHVLGVEVEQRLTTRSPEERVQLLRRRVRDLERELVAANDEHELLLELQRQISARLGAAPAAGDDASKGFPSTEVWQASHDYYAAKLEEIMKSARETRWNREALRTRIADLQQQLGGLDSCRTVSLWDVVVEVDLTGARGKLAVEYFVGNCGWQPEYDLRTAGDARSVELVYRARIHQETGEDWPGVELFLSTARPRRGARGPEPVTRWVDLAGAPSRARRGLVAEGRRAGASRGDRAAFYADSTILSGATLAPPFAEAQAEGLSVRFALPQRETLQSRSEPTTVLVGEATLAAAPELYCAPALDPTVWLRGRATNDSEWVLLPGRAAIFFGDDFIGNASLDAVQPGEEFELHLGAVPGIAVERLLVSEEHDGPGIFSSTADEISRWRVRLEFHASPVFEPDGSVSIIVREAIPRSRDDRIEVEITESSHRVAGAPRWAKDQADLGIHTWIVRVPKHGKTDLTWELTISHPDSKELILD